MTEDNHTELAPQQPIEGHYLGHSFRILLRYRMKLNETISFANSVYAASDEYRFVYNKISKFNSFIQNNLSEIDTLLTFMISPKQEKYTVEQMEKNFGYPNIDLFEVDMDNF